MGTYITGLDVSADQPNTIPLNGQSFLFVKATEGHSYTNPLQGEQVGQARPLPVVLGFYHFLWPGNIQLQAEYFVTNAQSVPGDILMCDWERTEAGTQATGAEKDDFLGAVQDLRPDHQVGLYTNLYSWKSLDTTSDAGDGLWIADPSSPPGRPDIKAPWVFHQYSAAGGLDRNVANFASLAALRGWARAKLPAPPMDDVYTVKAGDTLSSIAEAHHTTWQTLATLNHLTDPNLIHPGQELKIP
jgi:GH25 family lysozyme M1 (1,4-beta-N-acetylmuramidase)